MTFALFLALTTACKKDKKPEGDTKGSQTMQGSDKEKPKDGSGSGSAATGSGSGSATADAGSGSGSAMAEQKGPKLEGTHGGGNCPSMVLGAETKAEVKGKDVVLTITSADKDAIATIQKRGEELLKEKKDPPTGKVHDQKGSQGGAMGICPVYWPEGGKATSKKEANGIVITITPKEKPEELKKTLDERITKAGDWVKANIKPGDAGNKGGVGGGKGEHGGTHSGSGDGKGKERKGGGDGKGGGAGTGGGGGAGTGGGGGKGSGAKDKKPAEGKDGGW
jgi:hypothetical protein